MRAPTAPNAAKAINNTHLLLHIRKDSSLSASIAQKDSLKASESKPLHHLPACNTVELCCCRNHAFIVDFVDGLDVAAAQITHVSGDTTVAGSHTGARRRDPQLPARWQIA